MPEMKVWHFDLQLLDVLKKGTAKASIVGPTGVGSCQERSTESGIGMLGMCRNGLFHASQAIKTDSCSSGLDSGQLGKMSRSLHVIFLFISKFPNFEKIAFFVIL